ncbi:RNA polymerase sigma factor [uncultured Jatrophihabitans sp.]|uniref:RNA polymerase sigma factor n=1 Tax=uncultured Jatrophihabitans sp. TaxID=1610747 RepID=UPI0035C9FE5D
MGVRSRRVRGAPAAPSIRRDSFEAFVAPHWAVMVRLARRLGAAEWEDVAQDALALAWRRFDSFDPARGTARTWLLMLVHDQAGKSVRRRRPHLQLTDVSAVNPHPAWELRVDLQRAIAELTDRQRAVVELHYFLDLPVSDIAAVLGIAVGTVKSTLSDARRKLRDRLEVGSERY